MTYNITINATYCSDATANAAKKMAATHWKYDIFSKKASPEELLTGKDMMNCNAVKKTDVSTSSEHLTNCATLAAVALRKRYPGEANSHKNMLSRQKTNGAIVCAEFHDFRGFLRIVGPKPTVKATLDRIDNNDPEYAPGKVRWADKCTQNGNKGDSLTFHHPQTNEVFTTSRLAKSQGVKAGAIRTRRNRGWSDAEIIMGKRQEKIPAAASASSKPTWKPHNDYCPPVKLKTAREIQFERDRQSVLSAREECGGIDYLHLTPTEMLAEFQEFADKGNLKSKLTLAKPHAELLETLTEFFVKAWRSTYRPHVELERLEPKQRLYIEQVDPEWVAKQKSKIAAKIKCENEL